ncbi:MAG: prolyl oligopeptidase family serine peptidase [Psychrosphaera sp.]|nr:prolyl oligopeptidase family serine peptidase [Psychrosphaera sp.]
MPSPMRLLCVLTLLLSFTAFAQTVVKIPADIKNYAKDDLWSDVKISPGGDYLSAVTRIDGKKVIVLFDSKTLKLLHSMKFNGFAQPGEYHWIGDERIIAKKEYLKSWRDEPVNYGEYYAVNVNGRRAKYAFGFQNASADLNKPMWGDLLDPLVEDSRNIIVAGTRMSESHRYKPNVYRVNTMKGRLTKLLESPLKQAAFLIDQYHKVRFVTGFDDANDYKTLLYKNGKWLGTADLKIANESFYPVTMKGDSNKVYATYSENGGPNGLYLFDLDTGKKEQIFQHDKVSVSNVKYDKHGNVYAVEYDPDYPTTAIVEPEHPQAIELKKLLKTLEGFNVQVVSETTDGNSKIIYAFNQFTAGDYLLFNEKNNLLTHLFGKRPWANADTAANMVPVTFKSRDGIDISAYVTLPLGADTLKQAKNLPFVVRVHGGPHGIRDYLGYDSENQLYASRGIAVLQVNFRGSGGYGGKFSNMGYGHWGDKIQYDIIDGIKALVKQGVAEKNRLCIVGASFGGYSALQSAIIEPDLFQCAVGKMGVYDLAMLYESGDIQKRDTGETFLKLAIGTDKQALRAASPLYHLDKLNIPVFIVHGGKDKRAPVEHAELLKAGLAKKGLPYEWMIMDEEGHGFYKPEHREQVFQRTLAFLLKNLKIGDK